MLKKVCVRVTNGLRTRKVCGLSGFVCTFTNKFASATYTFACDEQKKTSGTPASFPIRPTEVRENTDAAAVCGLMPRRRLVGC